MTEFDLERMLARSQFTITLIFLIGFFGLLAAMATKYIDAAIAKEIIATIGPIVSIIVFFWFNRQRPHSAADQTDGTSKNPT